MMPLRVERALDRAHQLQFHRRRIALQLGDLEPADAVLGAEAAAVLRDQVVHRAAITGSRAQESPAVAPPALG